MNVNNDVYIYKNFDNAKPGIFAFKYIHLAVDSRYQRNMTVNQKSKLNNDFYVKHKALLDILLIGILSNSTIFVCSRLYIYSL